VVRNVYTGRIPKELYRPLGAARRVLGHSDEATTLRYYVRDAFSDEELFGEVE
jgi:integrase